MDRQTHRLNQDASAEQMGQMRRRRYASLDPKTSDQSPQVSIKIVKKQPDVPHVPLSSATMDYLAFILG